MTSGDGESSASGATPAGIEVVVMPAVAPGFALLFGLPPFTAKVVVAAASLPAGVNSWLDRPAV